jgi:hypothetical protein
VLLPDADESRIAAVPAVRAANTGMQQQEANMIRQMSRSLELLNMGVNMGATA